jgi:hypothetical protein
MRLAVDPTRDRSGFCGSVPWFHASRVVALGPAGPSQARRFALDARKEVVRAPWVKPALVQKPLEETRSGRGTHVDGLADFQS